MVRLLSVEIRIVEVLAPNPLEALVPRHGGDVRLASDDACSWRKGTVALGNFLFHATEWHGTPRIGELEKCDQLTFEDPTALPSRTVPWLAPALALVQEGVWFRDFT